MSALSRRDFLHCLALVGGATTLGACAAASASVATPISQATEPPPPLPLEVRFGGRPAQIEVGGAFVGVEMHGSSPLLQRISFYYPVANSADLSTDYWQRDRTRVMSLGLRVGDGPKEWIGLEPWGVHLTPYAVTLEQDDEERRVAVSYRFCQDKPGMVARIEITNNSAQLQAFELYSHLELSLRTSHTYALQDQASTEFDDVGSTIYVHFENPATGNVQLFVANAGEEPVGFATDGAIIGLGGIDGNWWLSKADDLPGGGNAQHTPSRPVAAFLYRRDLDPGETMTIVQLIGSCRSGEGHGIVAYLLAHHEEEVARYEESVRGQVDAGTLEAGDRGLDHSARWAKAILAANTHYLDGEIVPMPCPAEYNFFFTHDLLLTDLAAVQFDVVRVKRDLLYLAALGDGALPHAYYWKDDRFAIEYAETDNWNHFWFVLLAASYLRHSGDADTVETLYPLLRGSLGAALTNRRRDYLMWAHNLDWWDIGNSFGPRAYMTSLAIRALREFTYIATALGKEDAPLLRFEETAAKMQSQLADQLWDDDRNYLLNYYRDGSLDPHLYIGSLLAAHFGLVEPDKLAALVQTARSTLLDEELGVYNAFPMDFHQLAEFLRFSGNEAGDPFIYMNGGIWPHGNAWYALALVAAGEQAEARRFVRRVMTVEGIMEGPGGQPAMYETRNGNRHDPAVYGKVDKPQFLWAAGWYLYVLYHLLGVRESEWNVTFEPPVLDGRRTARFSLVLGGRSALVTVAGSGRHLRNIRYGGSVLPSAVVPTQVGAVGEIEILVGTPEAPYLAATNSIVLASRWNEEERALSVELDAFPGHENETAFVSPWAPRSVAVNGVERGEGWRAERDGDIHQVRIGLVHRSNRDTLVVRF